MQCYTPSLLVYVLHMTAMNNANILGAATSGGTALALLGAPVDTTVAIGIYILFVLLAFYLIYKIRNRKLR